MHERRVLPGNRRAAPSSLAPPAGGGPGEPGPGRLDLPQVWRQLQAWAHEAGFSQIEVADVDLAAAEPGFEAWLAAGFHGDMHYMAAHGTRRLRPAELVPGTVRVITARMDYLPRDAAPDWIDQEQARQQAPGDAVISVYARGRDYHKVLRQRLQRLVDQLAAAIGPFGHRVFTDSAPVLEVELAARAGLGWRGKHTLALRRDAGSMFFLGEIFVDLPLPVSTPVSAHCGSCTACLDACPTQAIVAPYRLDARRCISYLTIEHPGPIPVEFRVAMGNRVYGCDDCQLVCPWNRWAQRSPLADFDARLGHETLLALWAWDEPMFLRRTEGSAIRRIGFERWRRNLAVALGNAWRATGERAVAQALAQATDAGLAREHIDWALAQRDPAAESVSAARPAPPAPRAG
ncbi:MAG: tRNA epoxyqueuosine(34) reductase QueG [Burkholderiaceae bacterium]|nr:tRNA epoxyqueuosine(34) reductase QueG [Burkholderiaceae bacterium]